MRKILYFLSLVSLSPSAYAQEYGVVCDGKILGLYTTNDGTVMVLSTWRGDWTAACNVNKDYSSSSYSTSLAGSNSCWAWNAYMTNAWLGNRYIRVGYAFKNTAPPPPSGTQYICSNLPTYTASPPPTFVMLDYQ